MALSQRVSGNLPSPIPVIDLSPATTQRARRHVEARFSGIPDHEPAAFDLQTTRQAIEQALADGTQLSTIGRRHLRLAPWVILSARDGAAPLVELPEFMYRYRAYLQTSLDAPAIVNVALALLTRYPAHLPNFGPLLQLADDLLGRCKRPRCRRLKECVDHNGLLSSDGPSRFWARLSRAAEPVDQLLAASCLGGILSSGRFVEATLRAGLVQTQVQLKHDRVETAQLDRILAFALDSAGKRLRFAGATTRTAVAEGLLLPFSNSTRINPHEVRIREFLLKYFSDPRIDFAPWHGVKDEAIAVMRSWLVSETLEDFFRLLEYTSLSDSTAQRHWHYRKAFWSAYLQAGVISDAWVALAPSVDAAAQHQMGASRGAYGRLDGYGVQRNHAALLLRIGYLVIADWSHNGRFRVWYQEGTSRTHAPTLYQSRYTGGSLRNGADFEGAHMGSEGGSWQRKLAGFIRDNTGIRFDLWQLMPR